MSGPRKVLVFCGDRGIPLFGPSGASAHLRGIANALARGGHDVRVATLLPDDHRGRHGVVTGVEPVHLAPRRWPSWAREIAETSSARRLMGKAVRDFAPDLIWERHALCVDAGLRLQQRRGIPRVLELNAPLLRERSRIDWRRRATRMTRASVRGATRVAAVSRWLTDYARLHGAGPGQVLHIPNGTEVTPGAGPPDPGLVLAFVGSFRTWHHLHRLLPLVEALPEAEIRLFGQGPAAPPDHPRIRRMGRVPVSQLGNALARCHVGIHFVDPSRPWPCPLKVLDYLAAGLPVVSDPEG